jgi:hypothetical protein
MLGEALRVHLSRSGPGPPTVAAGFLDDFELAIRS